MIPEPYDPYCRTYACDMAYIDSFKNPNESREDYIRREEGTYNPSTGHFACDKCYMALGCPSSPRGWKAP